MGAVRIEVWALPYDGDAVQLPDLAEWEVAPADTTGWGSVSIDYPFTGRHYDLLAAVADDGVDLRVEVALTDDQGRQWIKPGLFLDIDTDDVDDQGIAKVTGVLHEYLLSEVLLPYAPGTERGDTAVDGTAGKIMRLLLDAAQGRGCLPGLWWTFTDSHDSDGEPWERSAALSFSPGQHYAAVLGTLRGYQLSGWELTLDNELRLVNLENKGVDRTVAGGPVPVVTLERGRDLGDAPRKFSLRGAITALLSSGKDGLYTEASSSTAQATRRRRIEGYQSFGNAADAGTLAALTQARLGTRTAGTTAVSHKLALADDGPLPLFDYGLSDWVLSATRAGVARRRVVQVTISGDGDDAVAAAVDLDAVIDDAAVTAAARLDALESGATVVGTSTPPPEVDDGSIPDAPTGLSVTSLWYRSAEGVGLAAVIAGWTLIPDARVVGYVVEWRYTLAELGTGWRRLPTTDQGSIEWSAVVAGAPVEVRVAAVNKWDRTGPFSAAVTITTEVDGTPPPVGSALTLVTRVGQVWATWDGRGAVGEVMPADFLRAEIHRSTTSGFTPHRPLTPGGGLDEDASTSYRGELRAGMTFPDQMAPGDYGTTWFYRIVLVDRTGNAAAASAQASIVAVPVQDGEVAGINAGKITAGIIDALVGIGQRLYAGDPNGPGWEGDPAGFRFYTGTGSARRAVLEFIASTGVLSLAGRLIAGAGVGVGPTVDVNPSIAGIDLYPNATTARIRNRAYVTTAPDGSGSTSVFAREMLNASGQTLGPSLLEWGAGIWHTFRTTAGAYYGGLVKLYPDRAFFGYSTTTVDTHLHFDSSGRVRLKGKLLNHDANGGLGVFYVGFGDAGATTGIARNYGATMQSSRSVFGSLLGGNEHVWVVDSTLNGFRIDRGTGTGGFIYYLSIGHDQ